MFLEIFQNSVLVNRHVLGVRILDGHVVLQYRNGLRRKTHPFGVELLQCLGFGAQDLLQGHPTWRLDSLFFGRFGLVI